MARIFPSTYAAYLLPPERLSGGEWASKNICLDANSAAAEGYLDMRWTPYLPGVLDAALDPYTRYLTWCTSSQVAKTTALIALAMYFVKERPCPMIFQMPSKELCKSFKKKRFEPIILSSPPLAGMLSKTSRTTHPEFTGMELSMNGCNIAFIGANSPVETVSRQASKVFQDEYDLYRRHGDRDNSEALEERAKTFGDSLICRTSTPEDQFGIWQHLLGGSNERWFVACPHCGARQVLVFGDGSPGHPGLKWPKGLTEEEYVDGQVVVYECEYCHEDIQERSKYKMVREGVWAPDGTEEWDGDKPVLKKKLSRRRRSFHIWSAYTLFPNTGWGNIAWKFLQAKGVTAKLRNFRTQWLGLPWVETKDELVESEISDCCREYQRGKAPDEATHITFGVDVQGGDDYLYFWWLARAWSGQKSWLVDYGRTSQGPACWKELQEILFERDWETEGGKPLQRCRVVMDSGHKPGIVYAWCFQNHGMAYKGDDRDHSKARHIQHSQRPIGGGKKVDFLLCKSGYYKDEFHRRMRAGTALLPHSADMDNSYAKQILAEQKFEEIDKQGHRKWVWRVYPPGADNHLLDCEVYAHVGADASKLLDPDKEQTIERRKDVRKQKRREISGIRAQGIPKQRGQGRVYTLHDL